MPHPIRVPAVALLLVLVASCGEPAPPRQVPVGRAHDEQLSNVLVETKGRVKRVLPDDTRGARHQHLLVQLDEGFTVKVAHNIDLAKRVPAVVGETVGIRGVYEFNDLGGVVHWTHKDPDGSHPGGWIRHKGRVYE